MPTPPRALTVAGSDSGGCAGIQADLKTFAALGVHGMSAVTAVTAQDTRRVHLTEEISPEGVARQIDVVVEDIGVDALKTGMLPSAAVIEAVAAGVRGHRLELLVVDPVMVTSGGDRLMSREAARVLVEALLPLAHLVTPNLHEAEILSDFRVRSPDDLEEAARRIALLGPAAVLVKGGHLAGDRCVDCLFQDGRTTHLEAPRIPTRNTHGSGCTLAAAVTAFLASGSSLETAVRRAKEYVTEAIRHSFSLGRGRGPLGHLFRLPPTTD